MFAQDGCGGSGCDAAVLDLAFLDRQCFGDRSLESELLLLFRASTLPLVAAMPAMASRAQDEAAHRLKGSCQGIGAWAMARAAQAVENAGPDARGNAIGVLDVALTELDRLIRARLAPR